MDNTNRQITPPSAARQRLTVEIPVNSLIHALEFVAAGLYTSVDDVVAEGIEALRNRPVGSPDATPHAAETVSVQSGLGSQSLDLQWNSSSLTAKVVEPAGVESLPHPLIPITAPRFLAGKFVLRFLARSLDKEGTEYLEAASFRDQIRYTAFSWTGYVNRLDRQAAHPRGRRLSTSFPDVTRDQEKSMSRFLEAYVGSAYSSGPKTTGVLPFLGFVSLRGPAGRERIGITAPGIEFARVPNPVLDEAEASFPPFRNDEIAQILRAIAARSPAELDHMRYYVGMIREMGQASRGALVPRMRNFYVRFWSPLDLNAGMIESMRATLHSRCQELGLVKTEHAGRIATYSVTDAGAEWLRGGSTQTKGD